MNYIILDVEANDGSIKEIIEFGAVKLDENLQFIDSFQSLVKPIINLKLSWFIEKLTKIKQEEIDNANIYPQVHGEFVEWVGEDSIILTWGKDDKRFISKNIALHNLDNNILKKFVNIQWRISSLFKYDNGLIGLKKALEILGIEQDGQHHRALDDAINTSKLFIKFFSQLGDLKKLQEQNVRNEKFKASKGFIFNKKIKIDYRRYYQYLSKLSITQLKSKFKMLEKQLKAEESEYLRAVIIMKKNCVKKTLSKKIQNFHLNQAGLTLRQIEIPLKAINELNSIKEKLIVKNTNYINNNNMHSTKESVEIQYIIKELKNDLTKINNPRYTDHSKEEIIQYSNEILQLIDKLLKSKYFKTKYKVHIEGIYERVNRNLNYIQPIQHAM